MFALMRQSPVFHRYGAGSPGVLAADSQIFRLEHAIAERGQGFDDVQLHLTVNELEITGRSHIYRDLGIQFARLVDQLYLSGHTGLEFTARILPNDSHMTGFTQSFLSYLRACYGASVPPGGGL
jgi:predicted alpha/beta superfamily hydrolase